MGLCLSSWAREAANHPQTKEGEKLLLPNRLSSFSRPALQPGHYGKAPGTAGLSLAHSSPGLSSAPGAALSSRNRITRLLLQGCTAQPAPGTLPSGIRQARAQMSPPSHQQKGWQRRRARSYIRPPSGTPCCRTTSSISTVF